MSFGRLVAFGDNWADFGPLWYIFWTDPPPTTRPCPGAESSRHGAGARSTARHQKSRQNQAAASNNLNEPRIRALRPFGVMAGRWSLMVTRPSATRSSSTVRLKADGLVTGSPAAGARSAFSVSHWSGLRSKSLSSFMLPQGLMAGAAVYARCVNPVRPQCVGNSFVHATFLESPWARDASAAHLKFLHHEWQTPSRNFKGKEALESQLCQCP